MSGLFEQHHSEEVDNLSEFRMRRIQYLEGEITRHLCAMKEAAQVIETTDAAIADLLYQIETDRLYKVDGYASMSEYARVRWETLTKGRLSQILTMGRINAQIDRYNQEQELLHGGEEFTKSQIGKLPTLENERQARALATVPEDQRMDTLAQAVEVAGGQPSARQINEAYEARYGKEATAERIGRLDTNKTVTPPAQQAALPTAPKHYLAWVENLAVDGRNLTFLAKGYEFKHKDSGKIIKPRMHVGIKLGQLADVGFVHKHDTERLRDALIEAQAREIAEDVEDGIRPALRLETDEQTAMGYLRRYAAEGNSDALWCDVVAFLRSTAPKKIPDPDDLPLQGSFIAGQDLSHLDNFFGAEDGQ